MEQLFRLLPVILGLLQHKDDIARIFGPVISELTKQPSTQPQATYDVKWLQTSLNTILEKTHLVVDGDYGAATKEAVRQFQEKYMPPGSADGWAGTLTTAAIYNVLNGR